MGNETINITVDSLGNIVRYYCHEAMANNANLIDLFIPYAYELMYDCAQDSSHSISDGIKVIEESIIVKIQKEYLASPSMCVNPQPLWIAAIDTRPLDSHVPGLKCTMINASSIIQQNKCCAVIQGNLTLTNLSSVDEYITEVLRVVSNALTESDGTAGYAVEYLGAKLEPTESLGADNVGVAINSGMPESPPKDSAVTGLGVFVVFFIVITVCGTLAFIIHRHRKMTELKSYLVESSDEDKSEDMEEVQEDDWIEPRRVPSKEQGDAKLLTGDDSLGIYIRSIASKPFREQYEKVDTINTFDSAYCFEPLQLPQSEHQQQTTALLQNSNPPVRPKGRWGQQPVQYTIGGVPVVPAHPQEVEDSDNGDIDSWAQTEGTIGSLEERELRSPNGY